MAEKVEIEIEVSGDDAQREFEDIAIAEQRAREETRRLETALKALTKAGGDNADAIEKARRKLIQSQQAQQNATAAVRDSAAAANASLNKWEALGGVLSQVGAVAGQVDPKLAAVGQTLGVVGGSLTALTGALGPVAVAMAAVTVAASAMNIVMSEAEERINDVAAASENTLRRIQQLAGEMRQTAGERGLVAGAQSVEATQAAIAQNLLDIDAAQEVARLAVLEARGAEAAVRNASVEFADAGLLRQRAIDAETSVRVATTEAERLVGFGERLQVGLRRSTEAQERFNAQLRQQRDLQGEIETAAAAASARGRGGGGGGRRSTFEADLARGLAQAAASEQALDAETDRLKEARHQSELGRLAEVAEVEANLARIGEEAKVRQDELEAASHERRMSQLEEAKAAELAAAEQLQSDLQGTLGPIVTSTTQALANIISGAKSAEEAFQGLLASFLEMIAQQAALEAVKEFAAAIGSFASQDYASGALHLASGAAWVGVAALAGGASAAVAPAAPAQAASPETGRDTQTGGGGTNVYNFNSPIIATDGSSDRALAGREIGALVSEGSNRYGRAS